MDETLRMAWMYPDILNLHGDRGNVMAFEKAAVNLGLDLSVSRIDALSDPIDFGAFDILYFPPGETVTARHLAETLRPRAGDFSDFIDFHKIMVVIGTTVAAFAGRTLRRDSSSFEGMGLIDAGCFELASAYSNDAVLETDYFGTPMEAVGGQIQMLKIVLGPSASPLGRAVYGYGNDKGGFEGTVKKNFMHTNLLGPVFVKNPWMAEAILLKAADLREFSSHTTSSDHALELQSNAQIKRFIQEKIEKYDKTRLD